LIKGKSVMASNASKGLPVKPTTGDGNGCCYFANVPD
jgi:hypothetical protein